MSINSLANAAVARRPDFEPFDEVPQGLVNIARAAATPAGVPPGPAVGTSEESANAVDTALHVLFGYIPTEVLTLYVAVLAVLQKPVQSAGSSGAVQSVGSSGTAIAKMTTGEWITFWCFLVATPIVVWLVYGAKVKAAKKPLPISPGTWPVWEMFAATVAYFTWALALPNTPFSHLDWYSSAIAGIAVLVASTVLGLLAPFFQRRLDPG